MEPHSNPVSKFAPVAGAPLVAEAQIKFAEGLALHHRGLLAQAQEVYRQVLQLQPQHSEALHLLGVIAAQFNNPGEAVDFIRKALALNPRNAAAHANCGNALKDLGQYQAAIRSYDQAVAIKPDYAKTYFNRGLVLHELKHYRTAVESYDKAIAIRPDIAESYTNRGLALCGLHRYPEAIESYDKAIALKADSAEPHFNRGLALCGLHRYQEAIESYDKAIALKADSVEAHFNRGIALARLQQLQAAVESYDRAFNINPGAEYLCGMRLHTKMKICDWSHAEAQIAELAQKVRLGERVTGGFGFLALNDSLPLQRKVAELWANHKYPAKLELGSIPKHPKRKKIRLAYFSMDFRNHATSVLAVRLFESHDRNRFEIHAFSFGPDTKDEMRTRLEKVFDRFIDVQYKSDKEVAELARRMEIDIAIDLAGFTADSRTSIFAYRAAPIQVNYLGYPGTMGADYIDYLIADRQLIPEEARQHYAEKIAYLPNSYQVNDRQRQIADKVFTRQELGLPEQGFVFCCFNNNYKITPATFDGWMRVLKQVEGSVLWLLEDNPSAASNLRKEAQQRGVDPQRLVFAKRMPLPEHLARHRAADLFIDTLPCNAHTTASDALWAGLPVLTCTGEAFASRVAASLLSAIDLPELITTMQQDYEALAIELATNPDRLKAIRQKLQDNRLTTPLFDTELFTKHIEDAYTQMFERYQADLPPEHIFVGNS